MILSWYQTYSYVHFRRQPRLAGQPWSQHRSWHCPQGCRRPADDARVPAAHQKGTRRVHFCRPSKLFFFGFLCWHVWFGWVIFVVVCHLHQPVMYHQIPVCCSGLRGVAYWLRHEVSTGASPDQDLLALLVKVSSQNLLPVDNLTKTNAVCKFFFSFFTQLCINFKQIVFTYLLINTCWFSNFVLVLPLVFEFVCWISSVCQLITKFSYCIWYETCYEPFCIFIKITKIGQGEPRMNSEASYALDDFFFSESRWATVNFHIN